MPYRIVADSDKCPASKPFAVIGGGSGDRLFGCHATEDSARDQQKALYAAENKTLADDQSQALDVDGTHYPVYTQPYHTPPSIAW